MLTSIPTQNSKIVRIVRHRKYGKDSCFLCGCRLTKKNRADEHVIPKWVQERFNLWDQKLVLLNGTSIPYRQLVVPCCASCNTKDLSKLEMIIRQAVNDGAKAVRALPQKVVFQWLAKIFYGLLYKEYFLPKDRKSGSKATILKRGDLERFKLHHFFLQSVRLPIEFHGHFPASIFVHETQCPADFESQFYLRDLPNFLGLSIRLGSVGIVGILQDGGAQQDNLGHWHQRYYDHELHPVQFAEVTARVFYKASLMNRTPKYVISEIDGSFQVLQMPLAGLSSVNVYGDWNDEVYASVLSSSTLQPLADLNFGPGKRWTYLNREDGEFLRIDVTEQPWP